MTPPARTRSATVALAGAAALAALAPSTATAQDYDMDCKLLLCLPGGFPSGCSDALDHMRDRLRDGKSPIGFCAMSDGTEYTAYEIDYAIVPAHSRDVWSCPPGKTLYHDVRTNNENPRYEVSTFCYDKAYEFGSEGRSRYTGRSQPERVDFRTKLTLEPGTPSEFTQGWQQFATGMDRDRSTEIRFSE